MATSKILNKIVDYICLVMFVYRLQIVLIHFELFSDEVSLLFHPYVLSHFPTYLLFTLS